MTTPVLALVLELLEYTVAGFRGLMVLFNGRIEVVPVPFDEPPVDIGAGYCGWPADELGGRFRLGIFTPTPADVGWEVDRGPGLGAGEFEFPIPVPVPVLRAAEVGAPNPTDADADPGPDPGGRFVNPSNSFPSNQTPGVNPPILAVLLVKGVFPPASLKSPTRASISAVFSPIPTPFPSPRLGSLLDDRDG